MTGSDPKPVEIAHDSMLSLLLVLRQATWCIGATVYAHIPTRSVTLTMPHEPGDFCEVGAVARVGSDPEIRFVVPVAVV